MKRLSKSKIENYIFNSVNLLLMLLIMFITLYPFWNTVAVSFNSAADTTRGGISFWPRVFTLQNYRAVFTSGTIIHFAITSWSAACSTPVGRNSISFCS